MSDLPTVGPRAYWAAYRTLAREAVRHWWKQGARAQVLFLIGWALHAFYLKQRIEALQKLELHLVYVVAPSLLLLAVAFVLTLLRAPFRMARDVQTLRDEVIAQLRAQVETLSALNSELLAGKTLRNRIEGLISECDGCLHCRNVHPDDATGIARDIAKLCATYPEEPSLRELRHSRDGSCAYPPTEYSMSADKFVARAQRQLRGALAQLPDRAGESA